MRNNMIEVEKKNPQHPFNTAVLFLVFNRLDTTKQVLDAIREAQPPRLYIAADGARESRVGEKEKIEAVRDYILSNIDWECDVTTLFRETNKGCKIAVSEAIDWFFTHEEMGIILEDDCLPSQSFFYFCELLLERYKNDYRIWHINGYNHFPREEDSYSFMKTAGIWGWASWADRWKHYSVNLDQLSSFNQNELDGAFMSKKVKNFWLRKAIQIRQGKIDTWDYQWAFTLFLNNALAAVPNKNLIRNLGFSEEATHTVYASEEIINNRASEISELQYNDKIIFNDYEEKQYFEKRLYQFTLAKLKQKIFSWFS